MRFSLVHLRALGMAGTAVTLTSSLLIACSSSDGGGNTSHANAGAAPQAGSGPGPSNGGASNASGASGAAPGGGASNGGVSNGGTSNAMAGTSNAMAGTSNAMAGTSNAMAGASNAMAGASNAMAGANATGGSGGAAQTCAMACGANSKCEVATNTCVCSPGFVTQAGTCSAAPVGDPSTHTQADVCTHWKDGHVVTEPKPMTATVTECTIGSIKPGAITDTLVRLNLFRWLEGLGPVTDDAQYDADAQACSNLEAWWNFDSTDSPHEPAASVKCYTSAGAAAAGQSNIAWGSNSPAQSIDQYMEDNGNDTTLGHRRWLMNPPLNPIGIGYWEKGGQYNNASCLRTFGNKGTGPKPSWNAVPPAGFAPLPMAQYKQWSFEGSLAGIAKAMASVLRVEDNMTLPVTQQALSQGYGQDTMSFKPNGWTAETGKTYRVTITGLTAGDVTYDVKPVNCN